jgi:rieske iron-sulfur protein
VAKKSKTRHACACSRRDSLKALVGAGLGLQGFGREVLAADAGALAPPREDDLLVYAFGDRAGAPIRAEDLKVNTRQVFAWAMEPGTGLIRNGTRLNQVVVVRLDPAALAAETAAKAAGGVVAYSGVCTHTGCDVTDWNAEFNRFQCPCHESQFDPGDGARVVGGPAPWQLAALPLKTSEGLLAVAGGFAGRVGFQQPGLNPFGI